ncbi:MAG: hypothetical protein NVSMB2_05420 [Chloroflexota bacterium]
MIDDNDEYAELFRPRLGRKEAEASWDDVARGFGALGKTLGDAFRAAWARDPLASQLSARVASLVNEVSRVVDANQVTPDAQQLRADLTRMSDSLRSAIDSASAQARPELVALLERTNAELRRLTRLDDPS